ncbi:translation initiation factor IF-2-like [Eptesicus fuscus]|uniref:translation initiation factor IF-2-like n=1 Tax=Eptesicus fuscus TaxID=29078 RepID=UPI002403BC4D|nr:translation initiation factor IF-2-like [Eptesicus fuscus]
MAGRAGEGAGGGERGCPGCGAAGPPVGGPHPPTAQEGGGVSSGACSRGRTGGAAGGRAGSGSAGGRRRRRRRAGAARRACLGPAARSCVQYVCLGGRPRASVRRGPRGPALLRDCRSRSAPARLVPAGSCARPSDVNGGNGGGRGFGLSQAESGRAGTRGAEARPDGRGGPWGGGCGLPAPGGPARPPRPGWEGAGAAGAGRVTSRPAAPPPVPRLVRSREAHGRDLSRDQPWSPHPTLPIPAAPIGNVNARKHVNAPKHVTADGQGAARPGPGHSSLLHPRGSNSYWKSFVE